MAAKVEIVNLALTHLGVGKEIANLETEASQEASAARRVYDTALKMILRAAPWPFATRITALALIAVEPNTEWAFSYRYPANCMMLRRVLSGLRNDDRQSRAPYKIASDSTGTLIFTDEDSAQAEYTVLVDNPQIYPPDFEMAFSYLLAFLMSPRLTGGDASRLGERALKLYEISISRAKADAFNEEQAEEEPASELERARH